MAQLCANCCHERQHELPRKLRLRTDNSVSRTNTVQHLAHQTGLNPEWKKDANEDLTDELQKQTTEVHQAAKDNLMQSYLKYKRYYDEKATATPLKVNDYCYVLNPKADNQSLKFAFKACIWTGSYIVVKVLSNNNYVVRRTGTRYTQALHRIRLKLYAPNRPVPDVTVKGEAWETEFGEVLFGQPTERKNEEATITEVPIDNGPYVILDWTSAITLL